MYSTAFMRTDRIFLENIPPPPSWPESVHPVNQAAPVKLAWKESSGDKRRINIMIRVLQVAIINNRKRQIQWPTGGYISSNLQPNEYFYALMRPIPDFFNQLRKKGEPEIGFTEVDLGNSIYGATYPAADFDAFKKSPPMIVTLPDKLFTSAGVITSRVEYALHKVLEHNKYPTKFIVVTNLAEIAVFFLPRAGYEPAQHTFIRVPTTQPASALRVLATACVLEALPFPQCYFNAPDIELEIDETLVHPEGPPQDPDSRLLPDEHVFATCNRNSDFDHATLVRDRERALQFFRWNKHTRETKSKLVAHPGDTLCAMTNESGIHMPPLAKLTPIYPYDASELPPDTAKHLQIIQRDSPLVTAGLHDTFQQSSAFTVKILGVIDGGVAVRGICTVYRCHLSTIDGIPVHNSPSLCLKLFDDRFQPLEDPFPDDPIPRWFDPVAYAEGYAVTEALAYDKLRPAQGSLIPWFYGNHQFTLPDGAVLSGILMEYIDGHELNSDFVRAASRDTQLEMIQSCRHAVRVLDVGDVSQRDWHARQVLIHVNAATNTPHAVLIDFAFTTQTWDPEVPNHIRNYHNMFRVLMGNIGDVGLDPDLVLDHYGDPDDWDVVVGFIYGPARRRVKRFEGRNIFPFIERYEEPDLFTGEIAKEVKLTIAGPV